MSQLCSIICWLSDRTCFYNMWIYQCKFLQIRCDKWRCTNELFLCLSSSYFLPLNGAYPKIVLGPKHIITTLNRLCLAESGQAVQSGLPAFMSGSMGSIPIPYSRKVPPFQDWNEAYPFLLEKQKRSTFAKQSQLLAPVEVNPKMQAKPNSLSNR